MSRIKACRDTTCEEMSPALRLVNTVYCCSGAKVNLYDTTFGEILRRAVALAIEAGLEFGKEDFEYKNNYNRCPLWAGANRDSGEHYYRLAVDAGNVSACVSLEHHMQRKPFFWKGKRLAVRSEVEWNGLLCIVNSFAEDSSYVNIAHYPIEHRTVCFYNGRERPYYSGKPTRLFKVTHQTITGRRRD